MGATWEQLVIVAAALGLAAWSAWQLHRLPTVWRGGTLPSLPYTGWQSPEVNHRSFPVFTAFLGAMSLGALVAVLGTFAEVGGLVVAGGLLLTVATLVALPLWLVVNAVNRPRLVVPPTRRDEPGWWAARRTRHRRREAGQPETEHVVEILDVRAPAGERHSYDPYVVAVCTAADCGWTSDPVGAEQHPDPVHAVREQAAAHASTLTGPRRPLG